MKSLLPTLCQVVLKRTQGMDACLLNTLLYQVAGAGAGRWQMRRLGAWIPASPLPSCVAAGSPRTQEKAGKAEYSTQPGAVAR